MYARRIVCDRLFQVHLDRQGVVVDVDQADRILGDVAVDRHHHRDALADVEHVVAGERALRLGMGEVGSRYQQRQWRIESADIVAGIHLDHTVERFRGAGIDRADFRPGDHAAGERRVQRAWEVDIVDEATLAAQEGGICVACDWFAELARRHVRGLRFSIASRASTRRCGGRRPQCSCSRCSGTDCPRGPREWPPPRGPDRDCLRGNPRST